MKKLLLVTTLALASSVLAETDREFWVATLDRIARPVMQAQAEGILRQKLPLRSPENPKKQNPQSAPFEAFARTLSGIAPWLELGPDDTPEGKLRAQYIEWALKGIERSVTPGDPGYLKWGHEAQSLVEDAYMAQAFWRAPKVLWEPLSPELKEAVCREMIASTWNPKESNWLLFGALQHFFVLENGTEAQKKLVNFKRIDKAVNRFMKEWYLGGGVYGDGPEFAPDFYNSFVIHPMLRDLLDRERKFPEHFPQAEEYYKLEVPRFVLYANFLQRLIMPDGSYPQVGRSSTYRFGGFQALAMSVWLGDKLRYDYSEVKGALTAVLKKSVTDEIFDEEGWLYLGFGGNQRMGCEGYSTRGSPYLCCEVFLPLGLPANDKFWTTPSTDWIQCKLWDGRPYSPDWYHCK